MARNGRARREADVDHYRLCGGGVGHESEADEAREVIRGKLVSEERKPYINTDIYLTVLKGFELARRTDSVFAVYKEMRGYGIACNTITLNTMLDACAKCSAIVPPAAAHSASAASLSASALLSAPSENSPAARAASAAR